MNRTTSHHRVRAIHMGAVAAVAVLGLAACGGDDEDSADPGDTTAAGAAPATSAAPAATPEPSAATTGDPGTTTTAPGAGDYGPAPTEASATTGAGDAPAGASSLMTAESDLGTILVDGEGMTLYLFLPDAQGPSTCEADCASAWPSFSGPATAGEGVDESLLGTAARPDDGTEQVTYDGWPLYYFAQDEAPGDVNGQGVGDVWYVVDPDGAPINET